MNAVVVTPGGTHQVALDPDHFGDLDIPVTPKRTVVLGRNVDRKPGEGEYVAFWTLGDAADKEHEFEKVYGGMNTAQRMVALIFEGVDMEPELPTEVVNLDGVSVIRVDLEKQLPGHVVIVPERYVP